ncbi:PEP/pyruvate-binding domain-containing protein [Megalodesulfovibrio gigas]|uniref:Phosphoenolpyruvate synthase n=1 Tax=Megalodesulfovibrio gigas (strain ATCC 19364 / DSM 1382 / NCIMB 9332 / VKM B-1759) TaxID=1121448 RepID=T2GDU5_MEGG1|nr:PEP/pyruvate-binding domain-containing protein [Megalodesulfovibrio gigas]AGW14760.1 putative pyruvate, water dikinase [Megalodesulfovibrio gigas DSM 1382 = ATCC 19364]
MVSLRNRISQWLGLASPEQDPTALAALESLRKEFQGRCLHFKRLLQANSKSLHAMAFLEESREGKRSFTIQTLRSTCVDISTNVFTMIRSLDGMAPGKYDALQTSFKRIQASMEDSLRTHAAAASGPYIIALQQAGMQQALEIGGKLATLAQAARAVHAEIPRGFVITAAAFHRFLTFQGLQEELNRRIQIADASSLPDLIALSSTVQHGIIEADLPEDVTQAILDAYAELERQCGRPVKVAVRSSALGEDAHGASFAGQYRTELNVDRASLLEQYKEVAASKYGVTAMAYRQAKGLLDEEVAMCVGCLEMVDAVTSGVAYSANPMAPQDGTVQIHSVFGLPKAVVDGQTPADRFILARTDGQVLESHIAVKTSRIILHPVEGVMLDEMPPALQEQPSLNSAQALRVAWLALDLERYFGTPQDVEWAFDANDRLVLLQCRPLAVQDACADTTADAAQDELATLQQEALAHGGQTASPGVAAGPVFVVRQGAHLLQFPAGAVLVVQQALPRWAPLLQRAAAVVSASGSTAGHLANVAREFGVPAIFGIEDAVERLENAGEITVDADRRLVLPGRREDVLQAAPCPRKNTLLGSPAHRMLEQVASLIVPLTFLDPAAATFHPDYCATLHDITRFCHEKAVAEMFRSGEEHGSRAQAFPIGISKQLLLDGRPMQYWVVDLDDGFNKPVDGPTVTLDDIASTPMLAYWQGLTAIPWQGPPALDTRGFMSVMLEATANPNLEPGMASAFSQQTYFLISRYFMSLQSRTGFHFCTVEAMAGPQVDENTLFFNYNGGAASIDRRESRAQLIADLLAEHDFDVEVRMDTLTARLEGYDQPRMETALRLVGHLVQHTRQLDMIMGDAARAAATRESLRRDLLHVAAMESGEA